MATTGARETADQLKKLAQAEMDAAKERLTRRTAAARNYASAAARLTDAAATWERIQGEATAAQANAVTELIDSGMKPAAVAELLAVDAKQLRALRATVPTPDDAISDPGASAPTESSGDTEDTAA
jgi:hypothetical protein